MESSRDPIDELEERLRRYPVERFPVQHATAQYHLGVVLTEAGELARAEAAFAVAAGLFAPRGLITEHGKAMNALGAVLRLAGRPDEGAQVLVRAAAAFEAAGLTAEQGAAGFNLGLVRREADDLTGAIEAFEGALRMLEDANAPAQAASAARELGATRFAAGSLAAAREALTIAVGLADRVGDDHGAGAALNVVGLVELADGRADEAVDAFAAAAGAHPRDIRPEAYAMAKANLALAHERAGDDGRARLAARQALGVPVAPAPVRSQAAAALERLGDERSDMTAVLCDEAPDRRPAIVREELARWADAGPAGLRAEAAAWIDGQLARPTAAVELAEAWVGGVLELAPDDLDAVMRGVVEALGERDRDAQERFRSQVAMAAARFHVPQLLRLRDEFNRVAVELGEEPAWS